MPPILSAAASNLTTTLRKGLPDEAFLISGAARVNVQIPTRYLVGRGRARKNMRVRAHEMLKNDSRVLTSKDMHVSKRTLVSGY